MKKLYTVVVGSMFFAFVLPAMASTTIQGTDLIQYTGPSTSTLGRAIARGDVNGDGYEDVLIGAQSTDLVLPGAAYLIYGSTTSLSGGDIDTDSTVVTFTGETAGDQVGVAVAMGDWNGDGYDDLFIGANMDDTNGSNAGAVFAVQGQPSTLPSGTLTSDNYFKLIGETADDQFGNSLAIADFNADGQEDLIIGATKNDDGANNAGAAYIVNGGDTVPTSGEVDASNLTEYTATTASVTAGVSAACGDFNNDGFGDCAVGGPGGTNGNVYIIYGQADDFAGGTFDITYTGEAASDAFGANMTSGDVNGDGYSDLIVGAPTNDSGGANSGAVYVLNGQANNFSGGSITTSGFEFPGLASNDKLGTVSVMDYNNDGLDDIIIGTMSGGSDVGEVFVVNGQSEAYSNSNLDEAASILINGVSATASFSRSVGAADFNGDGYDELVIGETLYETDLGAAYIMYASIDLDGDGVLTDSGLLQQGTDCNDSDATVSTDQTYYIDADADGLGVDTTTTSVCSSIAPDGYTNNASDTNDAIPNAGVEIGGDGVDNDGDSIIDEANTIADNGTHPYYGTLDPADTATVASAITDVASTSDGMVAVTYSDSSVYNYVVFSTITSPVKVERYKTTGLAPVLHPKGKKIALLNLLSGDVIKTITLSTARSYSQNSLKLLDVRKDGSFDVVTTSRKNSRVLVGVLKLKAHTQKLTKKDTIKLSNKKVSPNKTKVKGKTILLKSKKGKVLFTLKANKKYRFVE